MARRKNRLADLLFVVLLLGAGYSLPSDRTPVVDYGTLYSILGITLLGFFLFGIYALKYGRKAKRLKR